MNKMNKMKNIVEAIRKRSKLIGACLIFAVGVMFVLTIQGSVEYGNLKRENKEMASRLEILSDAEEQLANAEKEVRLLKESTNALKEQVASLNVEKEELNNQLEELLDVVDTVPIITRELLDEEMVSLSELTTKKYWYRNATQREEAKEWLWGTSMPFSDIQFVAMYDGYIKAGIDLKEVKFDVNQSFKTITVTMPKSEIFDHNIPQETINVLQVKNNLFNSVSFNDYNRFISSEKIEMEENAIGKGILDEAEKEARGVVEAFLKNIPGVDKYKLIFK